MRVLIFATFYEPFVSGAERMIVETAERLAGRFEIEVVTARLDAKLPRRETKTLANGTSYRITRLGLGVKSDKWLFGPLAALYARRTPHALAHAVMESYAGIALWLYKAWGGHSKAVLTLQSGDLDMAEKAARIPRWLWRRIHASPDLVVGISTALTNRAKALGAKETLTVPNGVDFAHLGKVPRGEKHPHRIATVARLSPEKGLPYLLEAFVHVRERFADAELVIVGGGALEAELKALSEQLGIAAQTRFLGAKPNLEAMTEVAKAGIFVLPSLGEGLGIVLLEAQALDVPVVGTNVGGIPDVINHDRTGLLVPAKDAHAIADAVIRLFSEPETGRRLATEASAGLARFDWNAIVDAYAVIYHRLGS